MHRFHKLFHMVVTTALCASSSTSCILPEKCIFIYKTGHKWTGRVAGTAIRINSETPNLIDGNLQTASPMTSMSSSLRAT